MNFKKFCQKLRIEEGLTLKQYADLLGVSSSYISMYEAQKRPIPLTYIEKIIKEFNFTSKTDLEPLIFSYVETLDKIEVSLKDLQLDDKLKLLQHNEQFKNFFKHTTNTSN